MEELVKGRHIIEKSIFGNYNNPVNDTDANNLTNTGMYYIGQQCANVREWSYLLVFSLTSRNTFQINVLPDARGMLLRSLNKQGWTLWHEISIVK